MLQGGLLRTSHLASICDLSPQVRITGGVWKTTACHSLNSLKSLQSLEADFYRQSQPQIQDGSQAAGARSHHRRADEHTQTHGAALCLRLDVVF